MAKANDVIQKVKKASGGGEDTCTELEQACGPERPPSGRPEKGEGLEFDPLTCGTVN